MLTVCGFAREIFAGEDREETVIVEIFGYVANKQRKLWTETPSITRFLTVFKFAS